MQVHIHVIATTLSYKKAETNKGKLAMQIIITLSDFNIYYTQSTYALQYNTSILYQWSLQNVNWLPYGLFERL